MNFYQELIARILNRSNRADIAPRHVEAYMRLQYGTLDHLDARTFAREVMIAVQCIDQGGTAEAEALAASYGIGAS